MLSSSRGNNCTAHIRYSNLLQIYFQLRLFKCTKEEDIKTRVRKNINFVSFCLLNFEVLTNYCSKFMDEKSGGLACLLYSIVLSKGFEELVCSSFAVVYLNIVIL